MTKKILTLLLGMSGFTAYAQKSVVITAKLDQAPNDTMVVLYEPYSGESDSCVIKNHQFKFTMPMPKGGSMYIIQIGSSWENGNGIVHYLEDGKLDIRGKGKNFAGAKFTGSPWVAEWQEINARIDPSYEDARRFNELEGLYHKAMEVGDEDKADIYLKEANVISARNLAFFRKWITKNNNSAVTGYLLTVYIENTKERDSLITTLGEHALQGRIIQRYLHPGKIDPSIVTFKMGEPDEDIPGTPHNLKIGEAAPDFSIPDVNGKMVSLADYKGKYVFIDFWASWCGPCVGQVPYLKAAFEKYKGPNFEMLGISLDSKREGWLKGIQKHELSWTNLSSLKGWGEPVAVAYGISAIPNNVLIGPDGKIVAKNLYGEDIETKLAEILGKKVTLSSSSSK